MEGHRDTTPEDYETAKKLCSEHLAGNWADTTTISAKLLTGGYRSRLFLCAIDAPLKAEDGDEPRQVLVRLNGKEMPMKSCGEAAEAMAMDALWRADIGPKLIGVFPGGRLEQFVPSKALPCEVARSKPGLQAVAQLTARMHSLDVPLKKDPNFFEQEYLSLTVASRRRRANCRWPGSQPNLDRNWSASFRRNRSSAGSG